MILENILREYGATMKEYQKGQFVFEQGGSARYYYQIVSGEVKMNNFSDSGREFIQGIFKSGESFGEPPLFINSPYPANAEVTKRTRILQLSKENFFYLMQKPVLSESVLEVFAQRLYYKSVIAMGMSFEIAEKRILNLLDYMKKYRLGNAPGNKSCRFEFTRQNIANLTGLRVETVIRAIKKLETRGELEIINRKIYR